MGAGTNVGIVVIFNAEVYRWKRSHHVSTGVFGLFSKAALHPLWRQASSVGSVSPVTETFRSLNDSDYSRVLEWLWVEVPDVRGKGSVVEDHLHNRLRDMETWYRNQAFESHGKMDRLGDKLGIEDNRR